jgi:hypothetical protein
MLEFHRLPIVQTFGFCPLDESPEERRISALGVLGLAAFTARILQKIVDQVLH